MQFGEKVRRFYEPAKGHIWLIFVMGGFSAAISTTTGYFLIYITKHFSDYFTNFVPQSFWTQVGFTMGIYCLFLGAAYLLRNFVWVYPETAIKKDLIRDYYRRFITSDNLTAEKFGTGRLISILSNGLERWSIMTNEVTNNIYRWIILLSFSVATLAQTSRSLTIGFGVLFVIVAINTTIFSRIGLFWRNKRKEMMVESARVETKILMSKFEVLQNRNIDKEISKIHEYTERYKEYAKRSQATNVGSFQISRITISLFMIYICFGFFQEAGATGVTNELLANFGVNMGLMTTFATYFNLLIDYYINFTKDFVHVEKLWDTFDHLPQLKGYDTGKKFQFKKGDFALKNINFSYHKGQSVLTNFSLNIQGGKKTALVGHSGSGKTTLMKLLAGYMRPTKGTISIDGQDITKIRLDSYYPHIGYLTQDPSVFDGTIEENLLYGIHTEIRDSINGIMERMALAIELAECQFIYELEQGIHTEIGERGIRLSGGQKQRLAIAKIFLKNPEIILLDEPTAALDSYSEQKVARAFEHLFRGRTVIVIAHRLQTVKSADDIIVLDMGKIIERGTHEELLKLGGKYAGMVDLQSGFVIEDEDDTMQKISSSSKKLNKGNGEFDQETPYYA